MNQIFSLVGWTFSLVLTVLRTIGLPGLFALMIVESVGIPPLPSEVILPFSGVLIVLGAPGFTWPAVVVAAVAGTVVGAFVAYAVGRYGGRELVHRFGRPFHVGERELDRAEQFFARHGGAAVGLARLVPVIRAYISYPAGIAEMRLAKFGVFTLVGTLPFTIVLVYLGTVLGDHYTVLEQYFNLLDLFVVIGVAALLLAWYLRYRGKGTGAPA